MIILLVTKEAEHLPQRFRMKSRLKIPRCLFAPSVAVWDKVNFMKDD